MSLAQKASLLKCEKHNRNIIYLSLAPDEVLQKRTLCDLCLRYSQQPTDITQIEELLRVLRLSTLTDFNELKSNILKHLDQLEALIRIQLKNISQSLVPNTVIEHYLTNQNKLELLDFQQLAELLSKICDYDGYQHQIKQQSQKVYQQIRIINKKLTLISQELIVLDEYFQLDQPIYAYRPSNDMETLKEQAKESNVSNNNNNNNNNNNKCQLKLLNQMQEHSSNIKFVYLNDQELISSSMDRSIKIWNISTNICIQTLRLQTITNCLSLNLIGNVMVSGSEDKMVRVWVRGNKEFEWKQTQQEHSKPIISILFNRLQDTQFISGSSDSKIIIWVQHTDNLYKVKQVLKVSNEITCLQFNKDYTLLAAGTRGRNITIWQAVSKDWIFRQNLDEGFVIRSVSFNNQSNLLASAYADKTIRLWREDKNKHYICFQQLSGHLDYIWVIKFDFEKNLLFSGGKDKKIIIWKVDQNDLWVQDNIIEEESGIQTVSIYNSMIAIGLESKNIKLYAIS